MDNAPTYVKKKHLTALNKIIRRQFTFKAVSKMKKDEVDKIFKEHFRYSIPNKEFLLKDSKKDLLIDLKELDKMTMPIYKKYISDKKIKQVKKALKKPTKVIKKPFKPDVGIYGRPNAGNVLSSLYTLFIENKGVLKNDVAYSSRKEVNKDLKIYKNWLMKNKSNKAVKQMLNYLKNPKSKFKLPK